MPPSPDLIQFIHMLEHIKSKYPTPPKYCTKTCTMIVLHLRHPEPRRMPIIVNVAHKIFMLTSPF